MTMFEELYALAMHATLTMTVSADEPSGRLTINVIPKPRKDTGEAALTQPLSLTATPQEFDAGFLDALRGYREVRQSLEQQADATREVIEAAKAASVKKASEATAKAGATRSAATTTKPVAATAPPTDPASSAADDDEGEETVPDAAGMPAAVGGDSFDLFG